MKALARRLLVAGVMMVTAIAPAYSQDLTPRAPEIVLMQGNAPSPVGMPTAAFEGNANPARSYVIADALIWTRSMTNGPLFVNNITGATVIDTRSVMRFDWTAAPKVTLGLGLGDGLSAEICWFGFYDFRARGTSGPFNADTANIAALPFRNGPLLAFNVGDTQRYDYRSRLTNAELNARQQVNDRLSVLVGFRYLNLAEQFNGNLIMADGTPFGNYGVRTQNNLWGGQLGADYALPLTDRLSLAANGKAGIFGGAESQSTSGSFLGGFAPDTPIFNQRGVQTGVVPGAPISAERRASSCHVAFVGEVGLTLTYKVTERLSLRGGYNLMWIDGVALAPNQFTTSNFAPGGAGGINTRGNLFMHGAVVGLDFRF